MWPGLVIKFCVIDFERILTVLRNTYKFIDLCFYRPFPSSKKFHFQNEAKCKTFVVEMSFICIIIKTHFHNKDFALSLVLKVKLFGTRKWPIGCLFKRMVN